MSASGSRWTSSPLRSSASSSTNRSTTCDRDDDLDLVEAELDPVSSPPGDPPLPPDLPDRDEFDERRVAGKLEDERRARPRRASRAAPRRIGRPFQLLAPGARRPAIAARQRFDARRSCRGPSGGGGPHSRPSPARRRLGVDVAVLDVRRAHGRRHRRTARTRGIARKRSAGGQVEDAVFELDLDRAPISGAVTPEDPSSRPPAPDAVAEVRPSTLLEGVLLDHLERVDRARPAVRGPRSGATSTSGIELPRAPVVGQHHSMISASRACASWSSTGATASTRRSRLRSIRSAEPMYHSRRRRCRSSRCASARGTRR